MIISLVKVSKEQALSILKYLYKYKALLEEQDPASLSIFSDTSSLGKTYDHEILHGELINE